MRRALRAAAPTAFLVLAACTEQDSAGFERAVDSFFVSLFQFFLVMMLIAAAFFVLWALIFAGAATAVIAGIKRLTDRHAEQRPRPPDQETAGASPPPPAARNDPDWVGVGMIIFGVVLLLAAAPTVLSVNLGPTSAGQVTIPLPLIVGGAALIWFAQRRRRAQAPQQAPPPTPVEGDDDRAAG